MKKILPLLFALIGLAIGAGAGFVLKPAPVAEMECEEGDQKCAQEAKAKSYTAMSVERVVEDETPRSYVEMKKPFVVPVITKTAVSSLVVLSISLEIDDGMKDLIFSREPKLRDAFLDILFAHANSGGFSASFTKRQAMADLRGSLLKAAQEVIGSVVYKVLITDIVRQDV